jgi:hypothetical protein
MPRKFFKSFEENHVKYLKAQCLYQSKVVDFRSVGGEITTNGHQIDKGTS